MAESRLDSSDLSQDNDCSLTFGSDSRTPKNVLKFGAKKLPNLVQNPYLSRKYQMGEIYNYRGKIKLF